MRTLDQGRVDHIRDICRSSIDFDRCYETSSTAWTDRHWLAQSVLNILDGKIDPQIIAENTERTSRAVPPSST